MEKAKIVGWDDSIASSAFQKGLPTDPPFFGKLIMGENSTLADSYALAEKNSQRDEPKRPQKSLEQSCKDVGPAQKKASDKPLNDKNKLGSRHRDRSLSIGGSAPKVHTKFSMPINQILRDLKEKPWFKMSQPTKGDTSRWTSRSTAHSTEVQGKQPMVASLG